MKILFRLLILVLLMSCGGSSSEEGAEIDNDFETEAEQNEKYTIKVIRDSYSVERIKKEIAQKISKLEAIQEEEEKEESSSVFERCLNNEATAIEEVLSILKSDDAEKRQALYDEMFNMVDDEGGFELTNTAVLEAFWANLYRPEDELSIIDVAGYNEMVGYGKEFEAFLLSGKVHEGGLILYWLGQDAKSQKALEYAEKMIMNPKATVQLLADGFNCLRGFALNGTPAVRKRVVKFCYQAYEKGIVAKSNFLVLDQKNEDTNPASALFDILCDYGGPEILPLIKQYPKVKNKDIEILDALVRFEGAVHRDTVLRRLRNPKNFENTLDAAFDLYGQTKDTSLIHQILLGLANDPDLSAYEIGKVMSKLYEVNAQNHLAHLKKHIKNKELVEKILSINEIRQKTKEQVLDELIKDGFISKTKADSLLKIKNEISEYQNYYGCASSVLYDAGVYSTIYNSNANEPFDYDYTVKRILALAQEEIGSCTVWMDTSSMEGEFYSYTITVINNNKVFVIECKSNPETTMDIEMLMALVDKIVDENETKSEFYFTTENEESNQTIVVFGQPDKCRELVQRYRLNE